MPKSKEPSTRLALSFVVSSPIGLLRCTVLENKLVSIEFTDDDNFLTPPTNDFSKKVAKELIAYFKSADHCFSFAIEPRGTPFQQSVWKALSAIPSGKTLTYGQLAKQLKSGPRAIGQACRTNPIPIVIPCHRIVASNHLGGYAGQQQGKIFQIKEWLLKHEG